MREGEEPGEEVAGEIDFAGFEELMAGGDEVIEDIFQDFTRQFPGWIDDMDAACSQGDAGAFAALAHRVKGSTSTFGLVGLSARLAELQKLGQSGDLGSLDPGWRARILGSFHAAVAQLKKPR